MTYQNQNKIQTLRLDLNSNLVSLLQEQKEIKKLAYETENQKERLTWLNKLETISLEIQEIKDLLIVLRNLEFRGH